jgi:hypothetical protein
MKNSMIFTEDELSRIEEVKKATFVCDSSVKNRHGGWANVPVAIFYQEKKHPDSGSHYFGLYVDPRRGLCITNGQSAVDEPINAVIAKNGEVIYSIHRHDYRVSEDKSVWIDGGRDYLRTDPSFTVVQLQIVKDRLELVL